MIADLLDVASIEAGRLELRLGEHDVRMLVDAVVDLYRAAHPDRTIHVAQSEGPLVVSCDALRLEQVVGNLASNALKYSPPDRRVEVALHPDGEEAVIAVTDHGGGIAEPDRRHLFEPFHRAGHARDTTPGSGLGLFVVRRIVESHGGRVEVDSAPGDGSRFRILLPLVHRTAQLGDASPGRPRDARQVH
jgi:two-component system sensor histidine kinase MtrB